MKEKYLPIGTICRLEGGVKPLMIVGFCVPNPNNQEEIMDYNGCLYPEGVISSDMNFLFNHEQIEEILYDGFVNDEERAFKLKLNEFMTNGTIAGKPVDVNSLNITQNPNNNTNSGYETPQMFNPDNNN